MSGLDDKLKWYETTADSYLIIGRQLPSAIKTATGKDEWIGKTPNEIATELEVARRLLDDVTILLLVSEFERVIIDEHYSNTIKQHIDPTRETDTIKRRVLEFVIRKTSGDQRLGMAEILNQVYEGCISKKLMEDVGGFIKYRNYIAHNLPNRPKTPDVYTVYSGLKDFISKCGITP